MSDLKAAIEQWDVEQGAFAEEYERVIVDAARWAADLHEAINAALGTTANPNTIRHELAPEDT